MANRIPLAEIAVYQNKAGNVQATISVRKIWNQPAKDRPRERYIVKLYDDGSLSVIESPALAVSRVNWGYDIFFATGAFVSAVLYRDVHGHYLGLPKMRVQLPLLYDGDLPPGHWLIQLNDIINNDPNLVLDAFTHWKL